MADPPPKRESRTRPAGPAPNRTKLHEAALLHLSRFAATQSGLVRVLDRRIDRWIRRAEQEKLDTSPAAASRQAAREVVAALVQSGVVNDEAFAEARARRLTRAGRSRRQVQAHLQSKGVAASLADAALPDPEAELQAALAYARRRRLGPFRTAPDDAGDDPDARRRELAAMARAGFPQGVAQQALRMDPDEALSLVIALKSS